MTAFMVFTMQIMGRTFIIYRLPAGLRLGVQTNYAGKLYGYPSAVVFLEAVSLFLFFLYKRPMRDIWHGRICSISRHSLAVYLIHFAMLRTIFTDVFHLDHLTGRPALFVPALLGCCIVIYALCTLIDALKDKIFSRIKMPTRLSALADRIDLFMNPAQ